MDNHLTMNSPRSHVDAHDHFKSTQAELCLRHQTWEEAQGRFERAALSQGLDGELTIRARASLLRAYEEYMVARAHHDVARRTLWETVKVVQLERELSQA